MRPIICLDRNLHRNNAILEIINTEKIVQKREAFQNCLSFELRWRPFLSDSVIATHLAKLKGL